VRDSSAGIGSDGEKELKDKQMRDDCHLPDETLQPFGAGDQ
jgi:hypothetical protein